MSHLVAAAVAVIIVAVAVIAAADLDTFLGQSERGQAASRNVSLHRLLFCFGIAPSPFVIAVVATLLALAVARSRRCSPHEVLVIATTAAIAATPLVWSHTLLLVLPVQTAALVTAFIEYRRRRPGVFLQWCGPVLVCVGVLALQLCEGVGGIDDQPLWTMGLVTAPAALAPLAMAAYVFTRSRTTATGHDARQ